MMEEDDMKHKTLFVIASIAMIFYIGSFFLSGPAAYPTPDVDKDEVYEAINDQLAELGFEPIDHTATFSFDIVANQSLGRYAQKEKMNESQLDVLSLEVPLYTIEVEQFNATIEFDPISKQITQLRDISI